MALLRLVPAALLVLALGAPAAGAAEYTVTSPADDGPGSLRAALLDAAASDADDAIAVAVPEIALASALPALGEGTALDGGGARLIPADGATPAAGLTIGAPGASVRDLEIAGFPAGVVLTGDATGAALLGLTLRDNTVGVRDDGHAGTVRIGGPDADAVRITGGTTGVLLRDAARVRFTRIDAVAGLAIDRGGDGPTPNAPGASANHPVLDVAETVLGATRVTGRLVTAAGRRPRDDRPLRRGPLHPARPRRADRPPRRRRRRTGTRRDRGLRRLPPRPPGRHRAHGRRHHPHHHVGARAVPAHHRVPAARADRPARSPAPTPPPAAGATRPLAALALDRRRVRRGRPAQLTVTLARAATLELWIARRRAGKLVGGRCRPTRAAPRDAVPCRRAVKAGAIVRHLPAGTATVRVPTRLDGRALPPGRYRLTASVLDPRTAATLDERRARFRIVP